MLSPDQARSAIYIDFEGEGKKQDGTIPLPHMVGEVRPKQTRGGSSYRAVFFRKNWKPVHNHFSRQSEMMDFQLWAEDLASRAISEQRHIVFWSIHEQTILEMYTSKKTFSRLRPWLFNLLPPTRKYIKRRRRWLNAHDETDSSLEECFQALYRKREPSPPLPIGAANSCRLIDKACDTHLRWRQFSDRQKGYAKDLVAYNKGDCDATWLIARKVANHYAARN